MYASNVLAPSSSAQRLLKLENASAAASHRNAAPSLIPAERELLMDGLGLERTIRTRHNAVAVFDNHIGSNGVMPGRPPILS